MAKPVEKVQDLIIIIIKRLNVEVLKSTKYVSPLFYGTFPASLI